MLKDERDAEALEKVRRRLEGRHKREVEKKFHKVNTVSAAGSGTNFSPGTQKFGFVEEADQRQNDEGAPREGTYMDIMDLENDEADIQEDRHDPLRELKEGFDGCDGSDSSEDDNCKP